MLRCVSLVLAIAFTIAGGSAQEKRFAKPVAADSTQALLRADVRGVWKIAELASRAPGGVWEVSAPLPRVIDIHGKALQLHVCARSGPSEAHCW